jgi:hypothetical protein
VTIGDELLLAYVDGETNAEETRLVETAMARDADLRARVEQQRKLRDALRAAHDPTLSDDVPESLRNLVMTAPVSWRWRMREALRGFVTAGQPGAGSVALPRFALTAAATLVLGVVIGRTLLPSAGDSVYGNSAGAMVAQGSLAHALDTQLAEESGGAVRIGVSFRNHVGEDCRTFTVSRNAGLACNRGGEWRIAALAESEKQTGEFHTAAAAMPDAIRTAVGGMIDGDAFDAQAERAARDRGWHN